MDVTPPQAPPAIVSSTQQEAVDALGRLLAVQTWLADQQQALPSLPEWPSAEGRDTWLASLDTFWQQPVEDAPGTMPVPRIDALATRLAWTMRDDAIVQRIDGTLDADAASLAERFARSLGGDLPPGMEARSLRIGTVDYAGAVIVLDRADPTRALRFMPDRGWQVFDSLESAHAQSETSLRENLARRRELPGVPADDTEQVMGQDRFVDSAPLPADVFGGLARRLAAAQREKLEDVWPATGDADPASRFIDEATAALDLHDKLDIFAVLVERESRLAIALNEQRLARVPVNVAQDWRDATQGYRLAHLLAAASVRGHAGGAPLTLATWSRRELTVALARRGITLDPDNIEIEAGGNEALTLPTIGTPPTTASTRMSLTEFVLRNTGFHDGRQLRVVSSGLPSGARAPGLQDLRDIARELNLAPRYEAYLRERANDPQGRTFREATMRLQQARMRVEATSARVAMYLPDEPGTFVDDHEERGYRMVEAVLDSPIAATRRTIGDHQVTVRQLVYKGAVVSDVLVIGVRDPRSSSRVVLYTPDAPDGRHFREFSDRATAAREFLYAPAFEAYLLARLPVEHGESLPNGSGRRFRVAESARRTQWVLAAPGEGRGTITEERFEDRVIDGDVRTALFDAEIVRQARDVAWLGRSTTQADLDAVAGILRRLAAGSRGPAALVEDTVSAVGRAIRATWRLYDSIKAGDGARAFVDFTEAYTASLSVAGWYSRLSVTSLSRLSLRSGANALRSIDAGLRPMDARRTLESRYAVSGVDLAGTRPDALGVHRLNGRRYIHQHELVFEVTHDSYSGVWRLVRPNTPITLFQGPAIEPTLSGAWRVRTDVGLLGGWVDDAAFTQARTRGVNAQELEGLTEFQRWTFQHSLGSRLRSGGEAARIYWQVISRPQSHYVTLRQRTAWNDALRTSRAAPPEPLPVGAQPGPGATWRVLPPNEWPTELWHYPGVGVATGGRGPLVLPLQAVPGSGLTGLPATATAPVAQGPTVIQLNLARYRGRLGTPESPGLRIIEDRRGPVPTYVVQPAVGFPIGFLGLQPGDFAVGGRVSP